MARSKKTIGEKYNSPFAKAIRALMEESNMTQDMLSEKIGRTRQTVSQYANGISEPGYDTLVKIADAFQVSVDYLLGRTEAKTLDKSVQAVTNFTGLTEENVVFLSADNATLRGNPPPPGFEDMFIFDQSYLPYYRARGAQFLINSVIDALRSDVSLSRRADELFKYWGRSEESTVSPNSAQIDDFMHFSAHRLSDEDYMRYESNEIFKALDSYLVTKCQLGNRSNSR